MPGGDAAAPKGQVAPEETLAAEGVNKAVPLAIRIIILRGAKTHHPFQADSYIPIQKPKENPMNKTLRTPVIAGNWKMNLLPSQTGAFVKELKAATAEADCSAPSGRDACGVVLCVPYVNLCAAIGAAAGSHLKIGAQNCHWAESGAFTGEVSAAMLKDLGVEYVIVGHSERRAYFGDTDQTVHGRTRAALDAGLKVILCVGEVKEERLQGVTLEVVRLQTKIALGGVTEAELRGVVIAYEPVWAIGTGLTATAAQANEVCLAIRDFLAEFYGRDAADAAVIQYGGSMNAGNAAELLAQPDVDGGLIGGASLKAADFAAIVAAAG